MSYQHTLIVGNVGGDVEQRYTPSGKAVANFSVAVNKKWGDQEKTTWFRVTAWDKLAELCAQYVTKGRQVLVEGEIDASAWSSQGGEARATLELTARNVRFLGSPNGSGGSGESAAPRAAAPTATVEEDIPF